MKFTDSYLQELRDRVPISDVVGQHVIWDKRKSQPRKGDYWACCPFHGEKSPSFHADNRKGIYHCFGCGVTGDHFRFLNEKVGLRFPQAVETVANLGGIPMPMEVKNETAAEREARERRNVEAEADLQRRRADVEAKANADREKRIDTAQDVWAKSIRLHGSHGDAYLQARGVPPVSEWGWDPHDTIRFNPSLHYELDRSAGSFPAVVARVQDTWGDTVAVWRIFLDRKLPKKAPVENAKVGLGPAKGGAVRIGGEGDRIGIAEGLETALAAWFLVGRRYPVWAGLSTSGVTSFEPPMEVTRLVGFADGDGGRFDKQGVLHPPPGMRAQVALMERLKPTGVEMSLSEMCQLGDALDLLNTMRKHEERSTDPA